MKIVVLTIWSIHKQLCACLGEEFNDKISQARRTCFAGFYASVISRHARNSLSVMDSEILVSLLWDDNFRLVGCRTINSDLRCTVTDKYGPRSANTISRLSHRPYNMLDIKLRHFLGILSETEPIFYFRQYAKAPLFLCFNTSYSQTT